MKFFSNEAEMQEWFEYQIAENEGLTDLIDEFEALLQPRIGRVQRKILESYAYCFQSLHILELISKNENISLSPDESLKPDLLLYAPETEGVVIVELKNIAGPTRQAGTELSAYCAEINNYLPFIADADIVNVIVSDEWPTLLRRHVVQDILWRGRKLICLQPYR